MRVAYILPLLIILSATTFFGLAKNNIVSLKALPEDWIMPTHDPQHTYYSETIVPELPSLTWHLGWKPTHYMTYANNKLVLATQNGIHAVHKTGKTAWGFVGSRGVYHPPIISNVYVYFYDYDGNIYCISELDGTLLWCYNPPRRSIIWQMELYSEFQILIYSTSKNTLHALDSSQSTVLWSRYAYGTIEPGSFLVRDTHVALGTTNSTTGCSKLELLDISSGKLVWELLIGLQEPHGRQQLRLVSATDTTIFFYISRLGVWEASQLRPIVTLYAVELTTGIEIWNFTVNNYIDPPAIINNKILVPVRGIWSISDAQYLVVPELIAIDLTTGNICWRYQFTEAEAPSAIIHSANLAYSETTIFYIGGKYIYAIALEHGKLCWYYSSDDVYELTVYDNFIIFTNATSQLQVLSTAGGNRLWTTTIKYRTAPIQVGANKIFVEQSDTILAFELVTGKLYWHYKILTIESPPVVRGSCIFILANHGVYCIDLRTRKTWWYNSEVHGYELAVEYGKLFLTAPEETYALDVRSGEVYWKTNYGGNVLNIGYGKIYVGRVDRIYCIDEHTGKLITVLKDYSPYFVLHAHQFYIVKAGRLEVFNEKKYASQKMVEYKAATTITSSISDDNINAKVTLRGELLYIRESTGIYALRINDDNYRLEWCYELPKSDGKLLAAAYNMVFIGGESEATIALDATTGKLVWVSNYNANSIALAANHKLFITAYDQRLHELDARTGKELWNYTLGENIQPVVIAGGNVIATAGGTVFIFGTGAQSAEVLHDTRYFFNHQPIFIAYLTIGFILIVAGVGWLYCVSIFFYTNSSAQRSRRYILICNVVIVIAAMIILILATSSSIVVTIDLVGYVAVHFNETTFSLTMSAIGLTLLLSGLVGLIATLCACSMRIQVCSYAIETTTHGDTPLAVRPYTILLGLCIAIGSASITVSNHLLHETGTIISVFWLIAMICLGTLLILPVIIQQINFYMHVNANVTMKHAKRTVKPYILLITFPGIITLFIFFALWIQNLNMNVSNITLSLIAYPLFYLIGIIGSYFVAMVLWFITQSMQVRRSNY